MTRTKRIFASFLAAVLAFSCLAAMLCSGATRPTVPHVTILFDGAVAEPSGPLVLHVNGVDIAFRHECGWQLPPDACKAFLTDTEVLLPKGGNRAVQNGVLDLVQ